MSWPYVQLKYELIRISEILMSWAKFKKSTVFKKISDMREILLTEEPSMDELSGYKDEFISIIISSEDQTLIHDLRSFVDPSELQTNSQRKAFETS